jgi:hypothetical protein
MMDAATLFIPGTVEVCGDMSARIAPPDPGAIDQARGAKLHTERQGWLSGPSWNEPPRSEPTPYTLRVRTGRGASRMGVMRAS